MALNLAAPLLTTTTSQRIDRRLAVRGFSFKRMGGAAVFAAFVLGWPAVGAAQGVATRPMLLSTPAASHAASVAPQAANPESSVGRQRSVGVDFTALDPRSRNAPAQIDVELFDGQVVTLERDRVEP